MNDRLRPWQAAMLALLISGITTDLRSDFVGLDDSDGFSLCETVLDDDGEARPECQAADIRFESDVTDLAGTDFGWALAAGNLNGDAFADLVVGDPLRNRVYIFFGRRSATAAYGLDPAELLDRRVSADTQADVILLRDPALPGQVASFGFSVAVGRELTDGACPDGPAAPLVIGAPGRPGTAPNGPGSAFYIPPGGLCLPADNPATPQTLNPEDLGSSFFSSHPEQNDEFGYSVGFGRVLTTTGNAEDVLVGARNALGGAGRVTIFPVTDGVVDNASGSVVRIEGLEGDGLGEAIAVGDLDLDFDEDDEPLGGTDDLVIGAVGHPNGKMALVDGPLSPTGGTNMSGVFQEGVSPRVKVVLGENPGDFFGFSVALSAQGELGVGAIYADNDPPAFGGSPGGNPDTNVTTGERINAGKFYCYDPGAFSELDLETSAELADLVFVARRSGDQLGFALAFADLDGNGADDLVVTARREDGNGLEADRIDQGTAYVVYNSEFPASPADLSLCATNSDCTGVVGIDAMIFGGDRQGNAGDELGFAVATGNFNDDNSADILMTSRTHRRVYLVTLEDNDEDRAEQGRNIRDDDDDNDGDLDSADCNPLDPEASSADEEIPCNGIDENCNGDADDTPDADGDGFDACGSDEVQADCDDDDALSFPGAPELCDGNDNACLGAVPVDERDIDVDGWVVCAGWDDTQGDDDTILGGDDCDGFNFNTFPGAAFNEPDPEICARDVDEDGWGDADPPEGVTAGTDCDDEGPGAPETFPGAAALDSATDCMRDRDDDDWGDTTPPAQVVPGTDCDDDDAISFPGAAELCDGNDNTCAGAVATDELDPDDDDWVGCAGWDDVQGDQEAILGGGDCDQSSATTFPGAAPNETSPMACRKDDDGDDWGDLLPQQPDVVAGTDCDDDSSAAGSTFPGAAEIEAPDNCMKDTDNDGYGDENVRLPVVPGGDCDDDDDSLSPGAEEIPDDRIDQDCNGTDSVTCYVDADGDGFGGTEVVIADDGACDGEGESEFDTDCDDDDDDIYPGVAEIEDDGIDQDCNGSDTITCVLDEDQDGFGSPAGTIVLADDGTCDAEQGESSTDDDCDDADENTFPEARERCDGNDNACAGSVPADETDGDGDGFVVCSGWFDSQADDPTIAGGDDCDDDDDDTFPGAGQNEAASSACMRDKDGDGYGAITAPGGPVASGTDCKDVGPGAGATFPGAAAIDGPFNCMKDSDDDDYGDSSATFPVVPGGDCDDTDPLTFLGSFEFCDGNDNACAGSVPADEIDADGDGYVACDDWDDAQGDDPGISGGGDCDETSAVTFPGAAPNEAFFAGCMKDADGDDFGDVDPEGSVAAGTDCDDDGPAAAFTFPGAAPNDAPLNCLKDVDGDDFGDADVVLPVVDGSDCDDDDAQVNTAATEGPMGDATCTDTLDNDCDGLVDELDPICLGAAEPCPDADDDGYADCSDPNCDPAGLTCGDCDDDAPASNPDGTEVCDNADNDCDGTVDDGFDGDDDGFTSCATPVADCDDTDPDVNPEADEVCGDGLNNDCNVGTADLFDDDDDGTACDTDCDDGDPALNRNDVDRDGFGTCDGDCDDDNGQVNPGLAEICADTFDNDCNPATLDIFDGDRDGSTCDVDCDDDNTAVAPGAEEVCDGLDNDCNRVVDDGFDMDDDGFTTCAVPVPDCDDGDPDRSPGLPEICGDGIDNDCNEATTDDLDADRDGFACDVDCDDGDPNSFPGGPELCDGNDNGCAGFVAPEETDEDGDGYAACSGWNDTQSDNPEIAGGDDCDPADIDTFPGAAPNESFATGCMRDRDGDDYGDLLAGGSIVAGTDCDDAGPFAPFTFPGAAQIEAPLNCMKDVDDDGYGDVNVSVRVVDGTDCDDDDAASNPAGVEVCDNADNDCDGTEDNGFDGDDDGFTTCDLPLPDCDDDNPQRNPGLPEVCNDGLDNDCDAATDDVFDADSDGATCEVDCDDDDPNSFPGAPELCDGNDNACAGSVPGDETDADGDGFAACAGWNDTQGDNPAIAAGDDCDPGDVDTFPGAAPNEAASTACMRDRDGDDFGDDSAASPVTSGTDCDDSSPDAASTFPGASVNDGPLACTRDVDGDDYGDITAIPPVVAGSDCDDSLPMVNPGSVEGPAGDDTCSDSLDNDCDTFVDAGDPDCSASAPRVRSAAPETRRDSSRRDRGTRRREP